MGFEAWVTSHALTSVGTYLRQTEHVIISVFAPEGI